MPGKHSRLVKPLEKEFGLIEALKPLHYASRILCINSYNLQEPYQTAWTRISGFIYDLVATIQFAFCCYVGWMFRNVSKKDSESAIAILGATYEYFTCGCIVWIITIFSHIFTKNAVNVIKDLQMVDSGFRKLKIESTYTKFQRFCYLELFAIVVYSISVYFASVKIQEQTVNDENFLPWYASYGIWSFVPVLDIGIVEYQFTNMVLIVRDKFAALNYKMERLLETERSTKHLKLQLLTEEHVKELIHGKQSEYMTLLKKFMEVHEVLCKIANNVNNIFSFQLLCFMALSFVEITFQLYTFYVYSFNNNSSTASHLILIWHGFFCLGNIYFIVYSCTSAATECKRTGLILHKLAQIDTKGVLDRNELGLYSLQILNRKLVFSACKFFPLDFTLMQTIVGAVTTYLVILIQFENSSRHQEYLKNPNHTTIS